MDFILSSVYTYEKNVIRLAHTSWDDWFTYETEYIVDYINEDGIVDRIGTVKIAQKNMGRTPNLPDKFTFLSEDFYSLGTDSMYYERLLELFKRDIDRLSILNSLRDVAYDQKLLMEVKEEDPFRISLSRSVSIHQISGQFHRLANGDSIKSSYKFSYKYSSYAPEKVVTFLVNNKHSILPSNVHAIIGRNGVGKSTLIRGFLRDLSYNNNEVIDIQEDGFNFSYGVDKFFKQIIYFNFSIFDSSDRLDLNETNNNFRYTSINSHTTLKSILKDEFGDTYEEKYEEFVEKLSFDDESGKRIIPTEGDKWVGIFMASIITCFERKPYLWVTILDILSSDPIFREYNCRGLYDTYQELKQNDYLRQFYNFFTKLSSGHKIVILSLTKIIELIDEEVLIIIDEPELYLHPPLLSSYIRSLSKLLEKRNGVALLATHSPVILQELPNNCIYKLDRRGENLLASRLSTETFAQNISTLMSEVFGLESEQTGFINIIDSYIAESPDATIEDIISRFDNQLGTLGLKLLVTKLYNERSQD